MQIIVLEFVVVIMPYIFLVMYVCFVSITFLELEIDIFLPFCSIFLHSDVSIIILNKLLKSELTVSLS